MDGSKKSETFARGEIFSSPVVSADGLPVFVGSFDQEVFAFSASPGSKKWVCTTGGRVGASPVLSTDGAALFVGSEDLNVFVLNPFDGSAMG